MNDQIEKQAIEEIAKVIERTEQIARDAHCGLPSPTMYAKDLYWKGYRNISDFLQMVENICKYEYSLSYEKIEEGIKRQMHMKGGAE